MGKGSADAGQAKVERTVEVRDCGGMLPSPDLVAGRDGASK
jgi:hypothetical protein